MQSDFHYTSKDYSLPEFCPVHMKDVNAKINSAMTDQTYYFAFSAGIKNQTKMKAREVFKEPKQTT